MPDDLGLTELADRAGVTPRTVRYYIAQGLLPGPRGQGPSARYGDTHLARLRLIRRLQYEHLPLAEIRARLETLGDDQIAELAADADTEPSADAIAEPEPGARALDYIRSVLAKPGPRTAGASGFPRVASPPPEPTSPPARPALSAVRASTPAPPPTTQPDRSTWERIAVSPDIEIHVRRPLDRTAIRQLDQLLVAARAIFKREK